MIMPNCCPNCSAQIIILNDKFCSYTICKLCLLYFTGPIHSSAVTHVIFVLDDQRICLCGSGDNHILVLNKPIANFIVDDQLSHLEIVNTDDIIYVPTFGIDFNFSNMEYLRNKIKLLILFS